jgi:hypothetical protein
MNTKKFTQIALALVLAITIVSGVKYVIATEYGTWNNPTATPPGNNTNQPINTGTTAQYKSARLTVDELLTNTGANILTTSGLSTNAFAAQQDAAFKQDVFVTGNVGIGTGVTSPLQKLQIGTNTSTSSNTPDSISLGATYSSMAGVNPKLRLYDTGSGVPYGIGVSANTFDFMVPAGAAYSWNVNGVKKMRLDNNGNLDIGGTLKIAGGSPGAGKVLTSDANGLASWGTVSAGVWTTSGNNIYNSNTGSIGIGTGATAPGAKLDVNGNNSAINLLVHSTSGQLQFYNYLDNVNYIESVNGAGTASQLLNFTGLSGGAGSFAFNGTVKISDGTQGADKVLTSDASGNASWATNFWTDAGTYVKPTAGDNVGAANYCDASGNNCVSPSKIVDINTPVDIGATYTKVLTQTTSSSTFSVCKVYVVTADPQMNGGTEYTVFGGITNSDGGMKVYDVGPNWGGCYSSTSDNAGFYIKDNCGKAGTKAIPVCYSNFLW